MNFTLTDEQEFLQDAARGALARTKTIEAARAAADGEALPDLWPTAMEAGWPGLLVAEEHGGAGLGALDAMLVLEACGSVLAGLPLLGHVAATGVLEHADPAVLTDLAAGTRRVALVPARPPSDIEPGWTIDPHRGLKRVSPPRVGEDGSVSGEAHWVLDAPGADLLAVLALADDGAPRVVLVESGSAGVEVEAVTRYDATRSLGHVRFDGTPGTFVECDVRTIAGSWYLAGALLAAESMGTAQLCLDMALEYAKQRFTFGRAIGSYQAVKHQLVEILRLRENARSLLLYAGWAGQHAADEFPLAASAARVASGELLEVAARTNISVHGGIGATWEHDAPYPFRRAQLSRRLLGGGTLAADRVAEVLIRESGVATA